MIIFSFLLCLSGSVFVQINDYLKVRDGEQQTDENSAIVMLMRWNIGKRGRDNKR